ncbi:hypothetical protein H0H87_003829 [Tephrocybe sp. NHM501043]|nr:hypothetical protein H0H87_003829 [Tephrocybe sp. NHM501043]
MPKSAKKRKDKAADFTKAKLKLGKGKQLASNAIDTSFKARSIALPSQSIAHEKDDDTPTTKRKLTFDDLITHAKHYSASMRKDAIAGFRELLDANWNLLESSLTALINACVRLIGDEDASSFEQLIQSSGPSTQHQTTWQEIVDPEENDDRFPCSFTVDTTTVGGSFNLQKLADISNVFGSSEFETSDDRDLNLISHLARTLQDTLIATFLDCAPSVFTPSGSPSETQVQLVLAVGRIVRTLYGVILQPSISLKSNNSASDDLAAILGYMTLYFPFNVSGSRDVKVEQAFQDLNLIFCELTSLLVLITTAEASRPMRRGKSRQMNNLATGNKLKNSLTIQTQRVSDYILQLLGGGSAAGSQLGRTLTPTAYVSLLPAIWALLNNTAGSPQHQSTASAILNATITHSIKTSSKSALKRLTIEFVARLVLLSTEPRYNGQFRLGHDPGDDAKVREWVAHLPQPLWEFGANNLLASEVIIRFLIRVLQQKSRAIYVSETIMALRSKLIPYFTITHPVRGQLPGPYSKVPMSSPLRRLALDAVVTLLDVMTGADLGGGLRSAVELAVADTDQREYWAAIQDTG